MESLALKNLDMKGVTIGMDIPRFLFPHLHQLTSLRLTTLVMKIPNQLYNVDRSPTSPGVRGKLIFFLLRVLQNEGI